MRFVFAISAITLIVDWPNTPSDSFMHWRAAWFFTTTAALPDNGKTAKFSHPIWREFMTSPVVKSGLSVAALPVGQQRRWLKKMACVRCFEKPTKATWIKVNAA